MMMSGCDSVRPTRDGIGGANVAEMPVRPGWYEAALSDWLYRLAAAVAAVLLLMSVV